MNSNGELKKSREGDSIPRNKLVMTGLLAGRPALAEDTAVPGDPPLQPQGPTISSLYIIGSRHLDDISWLSGGDEGAPAPRNQSVVFAVGNYCRNKEKVNNINKLSRTLKSTTFDQHSTAMFN
jgi:hypothetical protein